MKKENLQELLNSLSDRELAFFYRFREPEFMLESKKHIKSELHKRNLTEIRVKSLINAKENETKESCPRCQSENFIEVKDVELKIVKYDSYEIEINSRKCSVCGYNAYKNKAINWKVRINKWFGNYNWKRLK
jgi:ribosomal protein L37E